MTLRRLLKDEGEPVALRPSTAIAFAFDSEYLLPFKTMAASMVRAGTLLDAPVHIYSDDLAVFDDPFVAKVSDRRTVIGGALRDELYDLAANNVRRPERNKWNRGTFLKWAVFAPAEVSQVLFLDVDMVCLRPIEPLLGLHTTTDLLTGAQFQQGMKQTPDGQTASPQALAGHIQGMIDATSRGFMRRVNSGVMLIRRKLLSDDFRNRLTAYARGKIAINEQSLITDFFAAHRQDYRLKIVSAAWNFHESYLKEVLPEDAAQLTGQVNILHYPGGEKPWLFSPSDDMRPSLRHWWQARDYLNTLDV